MKKPLVLRFLLLVGAIVFTCQNAQAGLFDNIASQVTQTVSNASNKQQQNGQASQQQQTAQQKSQAADQQADQDRAKLDAANDAAQQQYKAQQKQAADQQAAQEQADQQAKQAAADTLAKRPAFKAKYDDFNWGDGVLMTKTKLAMKGKNAQEADTGTLIYSGQLTQARGKFLTYNDTVFDSPCTIALGFSIKTEKLSVVVIQFADNSIIGTLNDALTKKYGPLVQNSNMWGGVKNGEDSLIVTPNMLTGGNGILMEYVSGEDIPLLASESDEVSNAKISHDAAKL